MRMERVPFRSGWTGKSKSVGGTSAPAGEGPFESLFISAGKVGEEAVQKYFSSTREAGGGKFSFSGRVEPLDERCIVTSSQHPAVRTVGVRTSREKQAAKEGPAGWRRPAG